MKVLYITGAAAFGGASRSLFEALTALPPGEVQPYFVSSRGTALDVYGTVAVDVVGAWGISRFDHTYYGYYRGLRWAILLREFARLPSTVLALLRARRKWRSVDIIHVNEFIELPVALLARALFKAPLVVHVRALLNTDRRLLRTRWFHRMLKSADAIVAIDQAVRATLPHDLPVEIVRNSFDTRPRSAPDDVYLSKLDRLRTSSLKVGYIGNLLRFKGAFELANAAAILKERGEDVQFLIVGGSAAPEGGLIRRILRRLGIVHDIGSELSVRVERTGIADDFLLLGPTKDIQRVIPRMDVLAFPSHGDAPGRPVFEAAFFGVPSIVAVRQPQPDALIHRQTGIAIPEPDSNALADAIAYFARNRAEVRRMGEKARALAEANYRPEANAAELLRVYRQTLGVSGERPRPLAARRDLGGASDPQI